MCTLALQHATSGHPPLLCPPAMPPLQVASLLAWASLPGWERFQRVLSILVAASIYVFPTVAPVVYLRWRAWALGLYRVVFFAFPLLRKARGAPMPPAPHPASSRQLHAAHHPRRSCCPLCNVGRAYARLSARPALAGHRSWPSPCSIPQWFVCWVRCSPQQAYSVCLMAIPRRGCTAP